MPQIRPAPTAHTKRRGGESAHCQPPHAPEMVFHGHILLADAERGEDAVQDVIGRGDAGDGVNGLQSAIEIEQQHLMWHIRVNRTTRLTKHGSSLSEKVLVPDAGDESLRLPSR